jgi:sugar phosphate isomerase/epimerase
MTNAAVDPGRLSLNMMTASAASLAEAAAGCARHGIPWIATWRHKLEGSPETAARIIRDAGLRVSGHCRGGMFPAATSAERRKRIEDNVRAIDEAAALGTKVLVLVNGPAPDRDIDAARQMVVDAIGELAPYARKCGVRLAIEPLHPMFAADRSVVVTLGQANDIVARFPADAVGVIVDVYHVWWDPDVYAQIARAAGRILGFHISDWIVPLPDVLNGRGVMGDGVIEIRRLRQAVEQAGYRGPIEVEIFNEALWRMPLDTILDRIQTGYLQHA